jgi:hypothetical protein
MRGVVAGLLVAVMIGMAAWVVVSAFLGPLLRKLLQG